MKTNSNRSFYLIPYVVWMLLFVVAPIVLVVYFSLFDLHGNFSFVNYQNFFTSVYLKLFIIIIRC